jgi:OOP family OmpA-OmpF porin
MRKLVAPVLYSFLMLSAVGALSGCTASASIGSGETTPVPPPPPPPPPPPAAAAPAPLPEVKGNKLSLPGAIVFKTGKADIDEVSFPVLDMVKAYLDAKPEITKLRIEGHTDNVGDPKKNVELSGARALAVARYFVGKGIDCKRLVATGFGDTRPVADNKTEDGKAQNRRTDFINAEFKGKAIMGLPVDASAPNVKDSCAP